jgi:hypothetical protein
VQTNTRNNRETNSIFLGYDIFRLVLWTFLFSWDSFNLMAIYYVALPFTYAAWPKIISNYARIVDELEQFAGSFKDFSRFLMDYANLIRSL